VEVYSQKKSTSGFSHLADKKEIIQNKFSLNIPLYIDPVVNDVQLTLKEGYANFENAIVKVNQTRTALLEELGIWELNESK
jgi:type I restriction-modification system DNA methylase subunit